MVLDDGVDAGLCDAGSRWNNLCSKSADNCRSCRMSAKPLSSNDT